MDVKFVDGLVEQLKSSQPLPQEDGNPVYSLMQDPALRGNRLGSLVNQIHEHRPMDGEKPAPEKDTRILYDATENRVTFAVVGRAPNADGTYNTFANLTLERFDKNNWQLTSFFTSLDPTGFDKDESRRYVDIAGGVSTSYKSGGNKFAADFLQAMTQGEDMWGALLAADYMGRIDNVFAAARKEEQQRLDAGEKPLALFKIRDGHFPGRFDYDTDGETREERRVSVAPVMPRRER